NARAMLTGGALNTGRLTGHENSEIRMGATSSASAQLLMNGVTGNASYPGTTRDFGVARKQGGSTQELLDLRSFGDVLVEAGTLNVPNGWISGGSGTVVNGVVISSGATLETKGNVVARLAGEGILQATGTLSIGVETSQFGADFEGTLN